MAVGRPTKRTPETVAIILAAIEAGDADYNAAQAAEISPSTMRLWMRDEEFSAQVAGARARARLRANQAVFGGNPLAWITRGPGRPRPTEDPAAREEAWGKEAASLDITTPTDAPDLSRLTRAELRQLHALTKKAEGGADAE